MHEPGYSSPWEEYEARFSNEYWGSVAAAKDRLTDLPVLTAGGGVHGKAASTACTPRQRHAMMADLPWPQAPAWRRRGEGADPS